MDGLDTGRLSAPASNRKPRAKLNKNSLESQRQRILEHLHRKTLTTIEARQELDIMSPASRVLELRARGENIVTHWTVEQGHRIAQYVLFSHEG
jgi:hypothetical protein